MSYGALEGECPGGVEGASNDAAEAIAAMLAGSGRNTRTCDLRVRTDRGGGIGRMLGGNVGGQELARRLPGSWCGRILRPAGGGSEVAATENEAKCGVGSFESGRNAMRAARAAGGYVNECWTEGEYWHAAETPYQTLWLPSEVARTPRNLEQCAFRLLFPHYAPICSRPRKYSTPALPKSTMTRVTRSHGPAPTPPQEVVKSRSGKRKKKTPAAPNPEAQEATAAGTAAPQEIVDSQPVPTAAEEIPPPPPPVSKAALTFLGVYVPPPPRPVPRPLKKNPGAAAEHADPADTFDLSGRRRGPGRAEHEEEAAEREEEASHKFDDRSSVAYDECEEEEDHAGHDYTLPTPSPEQRGRALGSSPSGPSRRTVSHSPSCWATRTPPSRPRNLSHSFSPSPSRTPRPRAPSVDSLLLSPRVHQRASSPLPASSVLDSGDSGGEDDYGEQVAQKERVDAKLAARGYTIPHPEEEDEAEDMTELMQEIEENGFGDDEDDQPHQEKKKAKVQRNSDVAPTKRTRGKGKGKGNGKGNRKSQTKGKEKERDNVHTSDEEDVEEDTTGYKSGPVPKDIEDAVYAAYNTFETTIEELARQCDKSPTTLHQLVGSIVKLSRAETPYNVFQMYHAEKYPKEKEPQPITAAEYNRLSRERYLRALAELPEDEHTDVTAVWAHLQWLRKWHDETMSSVTDNWRVTGKFRRKVRKGIAPILQICRQMHRQFGVHIWGYVIDTGSDASMVFGAGEEFKNVQRSQKLDLNRTIKDIKHIFGMEDQKTRGVKVFATQLLPSELAQKDTDAARDNARKVFGKILAKQMVTIQLANGTITADKAKTAKMQWGDKLLDTAWKNQFRVINYPTSLANDGHLIGGRSFDVKKLVMADFEHFLPSMVRASKGEEGEDEDMMAIVPWDDEEKDLALEDQQNIPLVVSERDETPLRTVAESRAYSVAMAKEDERAAKEQRKKSKQTQRRPPSESPPRRPSPIPQQREDFHRHKQRSRLPSRTTDEQDLSPRGRVPPSRPDDGEDFYRREHYSRGASHPTDLEAVEHAPASRHAYDEAPRMPPPSRHAYNESRHAYNEPTRMPPPSRHAYDESRHAYDEVPRMPPAPPSRHAYGNPRHPYDDPRHPYDEPRQMPPPSRRTYDEAHQGRTGHHLPLALGHTNEYQQSGLPAYYRETKPVPSTSKEYGGLGHRRGPSGPRLPPLAERVDSSHATAPNFDRAASLAWQPPPPPVTARRKEREFEADEQPKKRARREEKQTASASSQRRSRFDMKNSDGQYVGKIFYIQRFIKTEEVIAELKHLLVEEDGVWKRCPMGWKPQMVSAQDLEIYDREVSRYYVT
ncbi:hypothetical protein C8R43DRAFT_1128497 [Mycena crocata]|nr:hypothetical protein C8R43DRAFT_1128497 [Mycena crocata]